MSLFDKWNNPLYYWWKVRKIFKRPKAHFHIGGVQWFFGFPIRKECLNPILDIRFTGLGWKEKYCTPRHEWDPYISIVFFRKFQLLWIFNWVDLNDSFSYTRSMATWEAILDIIEYNKDTEYVIKNHTWSGHRNGSEYLITIEPNLK